MVNSRRSALITTWSGRRDDDMAFTIQKILFSRGNLLSNPNMSLIAKVVDIDKYRGFSVLSSLARDNKETDEK